jgi:hypothetical protein
MRGGNLTARSPNRFSMSAAVEQGPVEVEEQRFDAIHELILACASVLSPARAGGFIRLGGARAISPKVSVQVWSER